MLSVINNQQQHFKNYLHDWELAHPLTCFSFFLFSFKGKLLLLIIFSKSSAIASWEVETFCSSNSWALICLQYEYVGKGAISSSPGFLICSEQNDTKSINSGHVPIW